VTTDPDGPDPGSITALLQKWSGGDKAALETLMPLVYDELRRMAARYLNRERPENTLQRTALVHEAFLRLVDQRRVDWQNRSHFFGLAAQLMRRILVDHARHGGRAKRGSGIPNAPLEAASHVGQVADVDLVDQIALDRALSKLEALDGPAARLVELRFYGGLTVEETAEMLGTSVSTVKRDWTAARAWLYREMSGSAAPSDT
jgi:RNA polymerase sigma-70 factor (ECF subfamily)